MFLITIRFALKSLRIKLFNKKLHAYKAYIFGAKEDILKNSF